MKRLIFIFISLITLFVSCENKRDTDDLAGYWQLTQWHDAAGVVQQPEGRVFYAIQLTLIKFQSYEGHIEGEYDSRLAHYTHDGNELRLTEAFKSIGGGVRDERLKDYAELHKYGVPADGRFEITTFDDDRLVLKTTEGQLTFRRY